MTMYMQAVNDLANLQSSLPIKYMDLFFETMLVNIFDMICVWSVMANIDSWCLHWCIQTGQMLPKGGPYGTLTKYCYEPPPLSALTEFTGFTHGLSVGRNIKDIQVSYFVVYYVRQLLSHSYQPKTSNQSRP